MSSTTTSSSLVKKTQNKVSNLEVTNTFTRLFMENQLLLHGNNNRLVESEIIMQESDDDLLVDDDIECNFTNNSPSPQPQHENHLIGEWANVNDVHVMDAHRREKKTEMTFNQEQQQISQTTVAETVSVVAAATETTIVNAVGATEKIVTEKEDEVGKKRKSKKSKSVSVIDEVKISSESRVFAKVCVANLRRSFGDLTNMCQDDRPKSSFSKFDDLSKKSSELKEELKICRSCNKEVFLVELIKAEKSAWHRNCFRCKECNKQLSVDSYSSHEGNLYCKPHFKKLFQPKVVFDGEEEKIPEVIIRESQPIELANVARESEKVSDDFQIDVRSKYVMFENMNVKDVSPTSETPSTPIRRSGSVLKRLARYENGETEVGVLNEEFNSKEILDDSDEEIKNHSSEIMQCKQMIQIKAKWEEGTINHKHEEIGEHRKAELNKFRSRLCHGKSNHLKELYEKGMVCEVVKSEVDLELLRDEKAKRLREMFESGEVKNDEEEQKRSIVEKDSAVFQLGVAKQSRSIFKEMDENLIKSGNIINKTCNNINKINKGTDLVDVVRSVDVMENYLPAKTEELTSKFNFFETYEKQLETTKKNEKKIFRITPPRDDVDSKSPEREVYRDPNVVRSEEVKDKTIEKSKTASKMLNVFRQLEEQANAKDNGPRPLKQFTPPRDGSRVYEIADEEEEEEESEHEEEEGEDKEDIFLKEVGSLARAKSLRARFERWESDENALNNASKTCSSSEMESIDSARNLREKFEQIQKQNNVPKKDVKVRRFVELQNQGDGMSEECAFCDKKVYAMEKLEANNKVYHKNCFRCSVCKAIMRMDSFTFHHGALYCKNHFKQLFKVKGNYDEGFGHETQKQIFARKQAEKENQ